MSATPADRTATPTARRRRPAQWAVMTRMLVPEAMRGLLSMTAVVLFFLAVAALVTRWLDWQVVGTTETDVVGLEVIAGPDGVAVVASLFILPAAGAVGAVVMAVVLAARTRVYVATGATRRAVAVGLLITALVMTGYALLLTAASLLVVGRGLDGARELLRADGAGDLALLSLQALGSVLLAVVAASAITVLFLRWPWWVGTGALILILGVLPLVTVVLLPALAQALTTASAWWGWDLALAVLATGVFWWIISRVPVR